MGVIGVGGAAIRARYNMRISTKALMQTNADHRQPHCARC